MGILSSSKDNITMTVNRIEDSLNFSFDNEVRMKAFDLPPEGDLVIVVYMYEGEVTFI